MMSSRKRTKPGSPSPIVIDRDEESLLRQRPDISRSPKSSGSQLKATIHKICIAPDSRSSGGIKGLLQDIVGGIALGALGMCFLLLLDYSNIINLETARVFRKTASDIFTSPEIIESIKEFQNEEMDNELVPMTVYNSMRKELSDSKAVIDSEEKIVNVRIKKASLLKEEISSVKVEYDKLYKQLGLDIFCPSCHWGMGMNCKQRVNYMLENYSDTATTIGCIAKLVDQGKKNGKCLTTSKKG